LSWRPIKVDPPDEINVSRRPTPVKLFPRRKLTKNAIPNLIR